jgi:hypothetical protein
MSQRGLGYKPDPSDDRDRKLGSLLGALAESPPPARASVEHPDVRPFDQGMTSSCTGQAIAQAVRLAYLRDGVACPKLSALDAYYRGRAEYGGQGNDDGSYLRSVVRAVVQGGIADERAWPFNEHDVNRNPNMLARRSAFDRKGARGYYRMESGDVDGVRRAIAAGHPVIGGWQVDEAFLDWYGNGVISGQVMTVGGHAVCVTSYDADGTFRFINSWSVGWGVGGYGVCDDMFIAAGIDLWALEVSP